MGSAAAGYDGQVAIGDMTSSNQPDGSKIPGSRKPGTGRGPGRPRNAAHDTAIVEAAQELLGKAGYNSLTIDSVAARAGVGRPTIYRRWPSKAALVIGALGGRSLESGSRPDTGNLRDDLLAIRRLQLELLSSSEGQRVLPGLAADMADHPELHPRFYERYVAPWREAVQEAVERAAARGEIPVGLDGRLVADVLTGPLVFRVLFAGEQLDERALEPAVDLILAGLGQSTGPSGGGRPAQEDGPVDEAGRTAAAD